MKTLCIYHANCADGLGAAWAVHRAAVISLISAGSRNDTSRARGRDLLDADGSAGR